MAKLGMQVSNANCTVIRSKEYAQGVRDSILSGTSDDPRPEGKVRAFRTVLKTQDGRDVVITGKLYETANGSLNAKRVAFKIPVDSLVWVDSEKQAAAPKAKATTEDLEAELLSLCK